MAANTLARVETRSKLKPRREPYWHRLEVGNYLGFRRLTAGSPGAWIARSRDSGTGKQHYRSLGEFDDMPEHHRFDRAKHEAEAWFAHLRKGGTTTAVTVRQACERYVQHLRSQGRERAADDNAARFRRWVDEHDLGAIVLRDLKPSQVSAWRAALASTPATAQDKTKPSTRARSPATINRDMTSLRAALNLALENRDATSSDAWSTKLRPIKNADGRRDVYLDAEQRRALIANAPADLADLLRALSLVPLRPGAMAQLLVADFDPRLGVLTIGQDKHGKDRKIGLPPKTATFFGGQADGKPAIAPLLARVNGLAWNKDAWKYPIKEAAALAGLPDSVTAYSLRHSVITDLIALHKLDTLTVAQLSGTSMAMIERHYGHLLRDHAAKALAALTV